MNFRNKLMSAILAATLTVSGSAFLTGCSGEKEVTEDVTSSVNVDLDYSKYSSTMLYDTMAKFSTDTSLFGKTVKIRAEYGAVFDFSSNSFINVVEQYDATACCAAYYPIELAEGVKQPALGSKMEMVGTFGNGHIVVTGITLYSGGFDDTNIDINAAEMSPVEIINFATKVRTLNNEYVGKTVRICGHYSMSQDGFSYLVGYQDGENDKLQSTWSMEIHSENVTFPEITDNYIRAYEVIGVVSSYKTPDGKEWPCIEVQSIRPITTYTV